MNHLVGIWSKGRIPASLAGGGVFESAVPYHSVLIPADSQVIDMHVKASEGDLLAARRYLGCLTPGLLPKNRASD